MKDIDKLQSLNIDLIDIIDDIIELQPLLNSSITTLNRLGNKELTNDLIVAYQHRMSKILLEYKALNRD